MFGNGLVEETRQLIADFGAGCRPFTSLGYLQAAAVLDGSMTEEQAIAAAQQGHRNYAKRQVTWFRREAELHPVQWLRGVGVSDAVIAEANALVATHLEATAAVGQQDHPQV